jgi:hypothetical protein
MSIDPLGINEPRKARKPRKRKEAEFAHYACKAPAKKWLYAVFSQVIARLVKRTRNPKLYRGQPGGEQLASH